VGHRHNPRGVAAMSIKVELDSEGEAEVNDLLKRFNIDNKIFEFELKNLIEDFLAETYQMGFNDGQNK